MTNPLDHLAKLCGILPSYVGLDGRRHRTGRDAKVALLAGMGFAAETEEAAARCLDQWREEEAAGAHADWQVVTVGTGPKVSLGDVETWRIDQEDGQVIEGKGPHTLPLLPLGRHLLTRGNRRTWLLSAPRKLPRPPRSWGVTGPLAGLRTAEEGGLGTYRDLGEAAAAFGAKGAAFYGINPVHAGFPEDLTLASPYSPSHRAWLNTLHIDTGGVSVGSDALIDYPKEIASQKAALRARFASNPDPDGLQSFHDRNGNALTRFATHQALSEIHGPYWSDWPAELQRFDSPAVVQFADANAARIAFHIWAQFQADKQLAEASSKARDAGMTFGLYLDLAVGTHRHGAETWENPNLFAREVSIGAPPDAFSPDGQNWNLAPMIPHAMVAEGFASLATTLRRQFQFAQLLRIDHILGFERSFWATRQPGLRGAYVKMPRAAMLAVTRIEAARAGATVIGEDLGNIPKGLGASLRGSGLLGCRLTLFERDRADPKMPKAPEDYDRDTLASFSTHDLPTFRGWKTGADIRARDRIGQTDAKQTASALKERKRDVASLEKEIDSRGLDGFLADTASDLVAVQIENVLEVEDQPNLPGTVDEYPNWRQRLPVAVQDYATDTRLDKAAEILNASDRKNSP